MDRGVSFIATRRPRLLASKLGKAAAPVGPPALCLHEGTPTEGTSSRPRAGPAEDNDPEEDRAEVCAVRLRCG